ncbi:MAG: hypothetical protein ACREP4_10200 [Stenotrophomonas sp.]|uniref:hypothetical protein n=1 Tax=Stenotrophomonas sp. TaxID=69392 RepID=UPI003D6D14AD
MKPNPLLLTLCLCTAASGAAVAQESDLRNRVVIVENVRYDYAQVLNVEPVFQTLRATRTEEHCEPVSTRTLAPVQVKGENGEERGGMRRFWDSVKGIFSRDEVEEEVVSAEDAQPRHASGGSAMLTPECKIVEVGREFRRPIAYDVDYVYKGIKFRSRLPEDPGNRLKLRVSITPDIGQSFDASSATP